MVGRSTKMDVIMLRVCLVIAGVAIVVGVLSALILVDAVHACHAVGLVCR